MKPREWPKRGGDGVSPLARNPASPFQAVCEEQNGRSRYRAAKTPVRRIIRVVP